MQITCPVCGKKFRKDVEDGDFVLCPYCGAELEVFMKGRKLDVKAVEHRAFKEEIEAPEEWEEAFGD